MSEEVPAGPERTPPVLKVPSWRTLFAMLAAQIVFVGLAFAIGLLVGVGPLETFRIDLQAVVIGGIATALLVGATHGLRHLAPTLDAEARRLSRDIFVRIQVRLTWPVIVIMSLAAGISEEMLFRGVLQAWAGDHLPIGLAILLPALLFSVLHFHSVTYVALVMIVALFLGGIFALTENIFIVMMIHTLYDVVALWQVRKELEKLDQAP